MSNKEFVIIVKGSGGAGLGDRIKSVTSAILYSKVTKRKLFIDWRDGLFGPVGHNVFYDFFDLRGIQSWRGSLDSVSDVFPPSWRRRLEFSISKIYDDDNFGSWDRGLATKKYSLDLTNLEYDEQFVVLFEFFQFDNLRDSLQNTGVLQYHESSPEVIFGDHLTFSESIKKRALEIISQERPAIGVHVRLSREFTKQKGAFRICEYFQRVDELVSRLNSSEIFLATDNASVLAQFRKRYTKVKSLDKWLPEAGEAIHFAQDKASAFKNTRDAITELAILAHCEGLVTLDQSSFSAIARYASNARAENSLVVKTRQASLPLRAYRRVRGALAGCW